MAPEDAVVVKHRISPFYATGLEAVLRAQRVERLVIAGVSSTWAVQAAARDAHDRDYRCWCWSRPARRPMRTNTRCR